MELRKRIIECLEESAVFSHSLYDQAMGRLEGRPLDQVNIAVFCDFFTGEFDEDITDRVSDFVRFFRPEDNIRLLVPELNNTSSRLTRKLQKRLPTVGCRMRDATWRDSERDIEDELITNMLKIADVVFFVTNWKKSRYEELFQRTRAEGYLVARSMINETRRKKKSRSEYHQMDEARGSKWS